MEVKKKELEKARDKLLRKKLTTTVGSVTPLTLDRTSKVAEEMRTLCEAFLELSDDFIHEFADQVENANEFKEENRRTAAEIVAHIDEVESKAAQVKRDITHDAIDRTLNTSQQQQVAQLQDLLTKQASLDTTKEATAAKKRAITKSAQVKSDVSKLDAELRRIDLEEWADVPDKDIESGIQKLKEWKTTLDNIISRYREVEDILSSQDISIQDVREAAQAGGKLKELEVFFSEVCDRVEHEDESRELYSGQTASTEKVAYPVFEGRDDESFVDFKLEIEKAFVKNRVAKADKVKKMREYLRGYAKKLVPESQKDINAAFECLNQAFGDPTKLQRHRTAAIKKLGKLPKNNTKGQSIVEWYLSLEVILQGILDLGDQVEDDDVRNALFSTDVVRNIASLFPEAMGTKILKVPGCSRERLDNVLAKVTEFRGTAQSWSLNEEMTQGEVSGSGQPRGGGYGGGSQSRGSRGAAAAKVNLEHFTPSLVFFNPPRNHPQCRICKVLEERGDTHQLYDNHHSDWATGCPRFMIMTTEQRNDVARAAKFCLRCMNPQYKFKASDQSHTCGNMRIRSKFKCPQSNCKTHLWLCFKHKMENAEIFKKLEREVWERYQIKFAYLVRTYLAPPAPPPQASPTQDSSALEIPAIPSVGSPVSQSTSRASAVAENSLQPSNDSERSWDWDQVVQNAQVPNDPQTDTVSFIPSNNCQHTRLSTTEALKHLDAKLKGKQITSPIKPASSGMPQFILGYTKGNTRPLLTLYDTGCLSVLFKTGVPEKELSPAVLKCRGPIYVNGVGNTQVKVNDEYMCTVPLADGSRAVLEGLTVNDITAALPMTSLVRAESVLKNDNKKNKALQSLKCYPSVGGQCDILLGILYSNLFPKPVHTLESGLTIYKLVISSHDKMYNATIGGPHESFNSFINYFGSIPMFLANLQVQLENYNKFGPPKLSHTLLSEEDIQFAKQFNELNVDGYDDAELLHILDEEESAPMDQAQCDDDEPMDQYHDESSMDRDDDGVDKSLPDCQNQNLVCSQCGEEGAENSLHLLINEDQTMLRSLQKAQEEGLSIEYRCSKCRNCPDCRNSYETERISLREEAEDLMVKDSIKIDWEKKCIECSLPVRGKEEEFLTNNRSMAVKVLQQQCVKYNKDEETKKIILKAFDKLIKNKHMVHFDDLDEEDKKLIESKPVNHWIIWRVVFKPGSVSSAARPVFDGSSKTKVGPDGVSGGRCLNDLVVKGRVVTLNLTKMVLRFEIGKSAFQGDLKQFYASIKLLKDYWHLQRVLYKPGLDPDAEIVEAVVVTLIWGIKCVSAQSEAAVVKLAAAIEESNPRLAELLRDSRFVDDLGDSDHNTEMIKDLIEDADTLFDKVGLACKGWTVSGSDPPAEVTDDGKSVSIGGMKWHSKMDFLEVPIPLLHFSKKSRGRLEIGTQVFSGHFREDLEKFVPKDLTRKQILSKKASLFDITGKFTPISSVLSYDLRKAMKETESWDEAVSDQLRSKWIGNFLMLEKLRGLKFCRAKMPANAKNSKMNLIIAGDSAKEFVKICGVWARFELDDGSFSCQHLISRSLLGDEDSTLPKQELEALTMASNLGWIVRKMLEKWVDSYIVISDSTIALSWIISDKNRLSLFHRNRAIQTRRGTDLDCLYHVVSEDNICDIGSRPDKVSINDVGPQSKWETGLDWMKGSIDQAVEDGILKPAKELIMNTEEEDDFRKGFVFEKGHEILTRGHLAYPARVQKVKERMEATDYLFNPAKFAFDKTVRVLSIVFRFIKSFKCMKGKLSKSNHRFQMMSAMVAENSLQPPKDKTVVGEENTTHGYIQVGSKDPGWKFRGKFHITITDDDQSRALEYLFRKASKEVKAFHKPEFLKKIAVEKDGIFYSKSRILDGQRVQVAPGFEDLDFLKSFKPFQSGFNLVCPVLDRFSPVSFAIAFYIHNTLYKHRGYESSYRFSLDFVHILEGLRLFREIGEECVQCKKIRGKYLEYAMGPLPDESFTVAPAFYVCQLDLYGPINVYVPGHSMKTRNRQVVEAQNWVQIYADPVSKCVNLQVIENKACDGIVDGITRLGCEVGMPKIILTDQDSGIMKALQESEVSLKDLQLVVYKEKGIEFRTAPVSGHNYHGLCERKILSVQEILKRMEVDKMRLHSTGYQTLMKLIENEVNNLPFGFTYGRREDNSPLLRLVFPNLLRFGRNNQRSLSGPIKLPKNPGELMTKIQKAFDIFFNLWNESIVPKMMKAPKWYDSEANLKVGDICYFKKVEGQLSSIWTVGKVVDVVLSKDGVVRRVEIEYQNAKEDFKRYTDRAARSMIKLFHIDDQSWCKNMSDVEAVLELLEKKDDTFANCSTEILNVSNLGNKIRAWVKRVKKPCKGCCCLAHCTLQSHGRTAKPFVSVRGASEVEHELFDNSWLTTDEYEELLEDETMIRSTASLSSLLRATHLDLDLETTLMPGHTTL